jgi:hypothetical protein
VIGLVGSSSWSILLNSRNSPEMPIPGEAFT